MASLMDKNRFVRSGNVVSGRREMVRKVERDAKGGTEGWVLRGD